jgi:SAM-dependent methyltransferase
MERQVSEIDIKNLAIIRNSVREFLLECAAGLDEPGKMLLDIAPQVHEGAAYAFSKCEIKTLDIDSESGADFIADICNCNRDLIKDETFDIIVCTEVLEHTLEPFAAANELHRLLKKGGILIITVPFNLRIHGPLPDCWRFTEHGLKSLFKHFNAMEISGIEDENRFLMPIHYRLKATK